MIRTWIIPVLASAFVAFSGVAWAQTALTDEESRELTVRAELDASSEAHTRAGYARSGADIVVSAGAVGDPGAIIPLHLDGRVTYLFQSVCDQQCIDVNLEIRNAAGEQIAEDINGDDLPVVTITPPRAGDYTLRIWVAQCAIGPCIAGVRTFRRMH